MCQEDINIGRRTKIKFSSATATTVGVKLVPANPDRIHLTLSAPVTNAVTIADSQAQSLLGGVILRTGQIPFDLDVKEHGQAVIGEVWGATAVGSETIGILEVIQEYE